ncbi:conserved hypothetical protein [Candidatus Terasakiella magnetica]|uniref:Lipoprotein n=1 Tax=Candidatus Terasakiella magnetica TaxID=1867952 RepID=A0A1C3RHA4_9PROT|nr:hypothetical protein [Candidatus Terasakiella magnetica]SCA56660.1 conserved hypothetical protein [Candidatus Terasakiella magnetica]
MDIIGGTFFIMANFIKRSGLVVVACLILSGCFGRVQPVYSVFSHPVPSSAEFMSLREISEVIELSAMNRKWLVEEQYPGLLKLTFRKKTHVAVIEVTFDQSSYSIKYLNSVDLLYNGSRIHRNYNRWVANLEKDIEMNLQKSAMNR